MPSTDSVDANSTSDASLPPAVRVPLAGVCFTVGLFALLAGVHDFTLFISTWIDDPVSHLLRAFGVAAFGSTVALWALAYAFGR